jgi:hypothetical protein
MNIEAMAGYHGSLRVMRPPKDNNIAQLQGQISALTNKIQDLTLPISSRPHVWCIGCYTKGHTTTQCPILRGARPPTNPMEPPLVGPSGGVAQVSTIVPFHGHVQYHSFFESSRRPKQ